MRDELEELPGVMAAQMIPDEQGNLLCAHLFIHQVDECHKQKLLQRVMECGRERGVRISEEQVTLSSPEATQGVEHNNEARVALAAISTKREGDRIETAVCLDYRGRQYVGRQSGVDVDASRMRVVAEATLSALQEILPPELRLILISVRRVSIEETKALVALVTVLESGRDLRFVGTALNERGDELQSVAKAVLAALNRFLARFLSP